MVPLLPTSACTRNAELGHSPTRRSSDLALENEGHPWRRIGLAHGRSLATGKRHKQRLAGESGLALRPLQGLATRGIAGADSMAVTIYHNPRCSKSRQTLKLLQDRGIEPRIVEYLRTPPDAETLRHLIAMLGLSPRSEEHTSELQSRGHLVCR